MKRAIVLALAAALGAAAAGCGKGEDEVSLALDWFPNSNHAGVYMALDRGYFEDEGLKVNVYTPSDPSTILQTVGAGRDDFGFSYEPDVLAARSAGAPVVSITAIVQHPLNSVMALKASGIARPGDLKGKKVGHPGIPSYTGMLESMLVKDGLVLADVQLVDVGFDLVPALLGGAVDAIVGGYWTHESIVMEQQGHPVNVMRMEQWGVPDFYELVLVTNEDLARDQPDVARKFAKAIARGYAEAMRVTPQEAVAVLEKAAPEAVDEKVEIVGVELLKPLWTEAGIPGFGWQRPEKWAGFADWMKSRGLIRQEVDPAAAYTNEFIQDD
jgi:putative hydroxymethylpyrimidine transport system substrate-binding protein